MELSNGLYSTFQTLIESTTSLYQGNVIAAGLAHQYMTNLFHKVMVSQCPKILPRQTTRNIQQHKKKKNKKDPEPEKKRKQEEEPSLTLPYVPEVYPALRGLHKTKETRKTSRK